jgi:hypothetical protein
MVLCSAWGGKLIERGVVFNQYRLRGKRYVYGPDPQKTKPLGVLSLQPGQRCRLPGCFLQSAALEVYAFWEF